MFARKKDPLAQFTSIEMKELNRLRCKFISAAISRLEDPSDFAVNLRYLNEYRAAYMELTYFFYKHFNKIDPKNNAFKLFCYSGPEKDKLVKENALWTAIWKYIAEYEFLLKNEQTALTREPRIKKLSYDFNGYQITFADGSGIRFRGGISDDFMSGKYANIRDRYDSKLDRLTHKIVAAEVPEVESKMRLK